MFYISSPGLVTDAEDKIKWWKEVKLHSIRVKAFHFEYLFEANDEKLINYWFIRQHAGSLESTKDAWDLLEA